jgi:hypothetical protein
MSPPDNVPDSIREAYYDWVDRRLLQGLRNSEPEVFGWIVDRARELIVNAAETTVRQLGGDVAGGVHTRLSRHRGDPALPERWPRRGHIGREIHAILRA